MLTDLQRAVSDQSFKIYDKDCIGEMKTFYRDEKTGKPEAQSGCHDDRVMMLAILSRISQEIPEVNHDDGRNMAIKNQQKIQKYAF